MLNFSYQNINISYTSTGKGSAITLLHGFLENQKMWNTIVPTLSKKNRVITIDLLGHGNTENLGYVHTMEEQAKIIRALLKFLNIRKVSLIGHSMGGYIALAFADLFPKNTKGFCLMNSTAYPDTEEKKKNRDRAIAAVKQNHKTFVRLSIPLLFSKTNQIALKKEVDEVTADALKISKQGIIASLEGMKIRKDRTFLLQNESLNKMIILGKLDSVLPIKIHCKQIGKTSTKLITLSQGHMSHIENNIELTSALTSFINLR